MDKVLGEFVVNGERHEVAFAPHKTLLEVLREDLRLTGTKHGCELGECGACAVLLDGEPVLSCLVLGLDAQGRSVETIEGMADGPELHPLQDAFAELGASQCGYCSAGFMLVGKRLLEDNPAPSRAEIRAAVAGNLCRCTGYVKIFEAFELAARKLRGEADAQPSREAVYGSLSQDTLAGREQPPRQPDAGRDGGAPGEVGAGPSASGSARGAAMGADGGAGRYEPPADAPWHHDARPDELAVIGKPWRKIDARSRVTGQTVYADDLAPPRALAMKLLRSTVAHARIVSIDTSAAEAMPGVHAVLVGAELPIPFGILPVSQDEHTLCVDKVRFVGDPVAAVAAVDEDTAWAACRAIAVEYEPLRNLETIFDAHGHPDDRIHDYGKGGNVHRLENLEFGDLQDGFARASHVREDVFFFEGNTHLPMEEHSTTAFSDPDGKLCVMSSTQTPHYLHRSLAKVLQEHVPAHKIRVIACPNGGGFGGKSDPFNHEIAAAMLAIKTGRPVKVTLTREEVFYCHRGRHPTLMKSRIGVDASGRILALDFESFLDGGAYGSYGTASTFYTGALQCVTYHVENYHFRGARFFTNKAPCGPKRGHGTPQPRFALEVQLDKVAVDLGIDPATLRREHLAPAYSLTANWMRIGSMGLGACIDRVVEGSAFRERWGKLPRGKGLGLACSSYLSGAGLPIYWNAMPHSGVQLKLDRSGLVTVFCGSTDIGQGSNSVLAYVVGEVLGLDPQDLRVVTADTDLTPVDLGSYSSRVTVMTGNAAMQAAERARELIAGPVAQKLEIPANRVTFAGGRVFDAEDPDRGMAFADAVQCAEAALGTLGTTGSYRPPKSAARYKGGGVGPSPSYSYTAAVVEVDVDPETGIYTVDKVWVAHDIGRALNPALVVGQVEGSVYMGLGEATMEAQAYRSSRFGVHKTPSMLDYKSPTALEMPEVVTYLVEDPDPNGPYGAKEAGQGPLLPIMPAVANAVYDAVGVRVDQVPVTPELVFAALQRQAKGEEPRVGPRDVPVMDWRASRKVRTPWQGGTGRDVEDEAARAKQAQET